MTLWLLVWTACSAPSTRAVHVSAAASLTDGFRSLEAAFEQEHPQVDVVVAYAGSQILRLQVEQGATAHVFASANPDHAQALVDQALLTPPRRFAANELAIVVAPGNPAGLRSLEDLPQAERLVIGTDGAPLGVYTRAMLQRAGPEFASRVLARVVSTESNARLVRAKVQLGEADAAIVYRTDAHDMDGLPIPVPPELNPAIDYVIGTAPDAPADAEAFVAFVHSEPGRARLVDLGFGTPR